LKLIHITSRDNSLLRRTRAVRDGKIADSIFIEGLRLAEEAAGSGLAIEAVIYSEELLQKQRAGKLIRDLAKDSVKSASVSEKLLQSISYTKTPQGIVVLATRPALAQNLFAERQPETPLLVILHRINNPVNVGAIVRTAEAAGATVPRHGAETFWGGYSAVFIDPDGHVWEVAHNPHWTLADDGSVSL